MYIWVLTIEIIRGTNVYGNYTFSAPEKAKKIINLVKETPLSRFVSLSKTKLDSLDTETLERLKL